MHISCWSFNANPTAIQKHTITVNVCGLSVVTVVVTCQRFNTGKVPCARLPHDKLRIARISTQMLNRSSVSKQIRIFQVLQHALLKCVPFYTTIKMKVKFTTIYLVIQSFSDRKKSFQGMSHLTQQGGTPRRRGGEGGEWEGYGGKRAEESEKGSGWRE